MRCGPRFGPSQKRVDQEAIASEYPFDERSLSGPFALPPPNQVAYVHFSDFVVYSI